MELIEKYLGGNESDVSLLPPETQNFYVGDTIECHGQECGFSQLKLQVYEGTSDDLSGQFYICYNKRETNNSYTISAYHNHAFDGTQVTISYGQPISLGSDYFPNNLSNMVYKYSFSNEFEGDRNGIIFTVGPIKESSQRVEDGKWSGIDRSGLSNAYEIDESEFDEDGDENNLVFTYTLIPGEESFDGVQKCIQNAYRNESGAIEYDSYRLFMSSSSVVCVNSLMTYDNSTS
jgi:hypothetical protein